MVVPYYPLCIDYSIDQVYDFIYLLYQSMLETYDASRILVTGSSSGATLGLGLAAHINAKGEGVPIPEKMYLSSPGNCFQDEKALEKGYVLNDKDILLDMSYMTKMPDIMSHGKDVPKYMIYLEEGEYTGLKEVYISYGGDEILLACYDSIIKVLRSSGVNVISEITEGLYHCYPFFPLVKEAKPGWEKMIAYHRI